MSPRRAKQKPILVESVSPNGNLTAFAEVDGGGVYFYLHGSPEFGVRSCWVRNLEPAPSDLNIDRMKQGRPPLLPRYACAHPKGARRPKSGDLEIVWLEEGDAAALLEGGEILSAIPGWSRNKGGVGFARDCTEETPLAWPVAPALAELSDRIARAREFWASWEGGKAWQPIQTALLSALERDLGKHSNYYAIDGGEWPPRFMLRIPRGSDRLLVTGGVSIRPQPRVDQLEGAPRRIELGLAMDARLLEGSEVDRWISAQATLPWAQHTWLGHGHTVSCDVIPRGKSRTRFNAFLLVHEPWDLPRVQLPSYRGDSVNLLWLVPVTGAERKLAEKVGSETLIKKLKRAKHGAIHRERKAVV